MPSDAWTALLENLRRDNLSGATAITRRAAAGLATLAVRDDGSVPDLNGPRSGLRALATVRPPFGSLFRLANEAAEAVARLDSRSARALALRDVGDRFLTELADQHAAIVAAARESVGGGRRVLTISASSLVRDVLLADAGEPRSEPRITYLESRPGFEGTALATELAAAGARVRLATDAAAGRLVGEVDLVLVGGDTLSPAGLVHKLGTLGLALAAREQGVPCYALLGSLKLLPSAVRGWHEDGGPADELASQLPPGVEVWNRYYDLTPLNLLSGVVTEQGIRTTQEVAALGAVQTMHPWLADLLDR